MLLVILTVWVVIYGLLVTTLDNYMAGLDYLRWQSVSSASGWVTLGDAEVSFGRTFHWLHVGETEFRLPASEFETFEDGKRCRIYYLRNVRIILSVEFPES